MVRKSIKDKVISREEGGIVILEWKPVKCDGYKLYVGDNRNITTTKWNIINGIEIVDTKFKLKANYSTKYVWMVVPFNKAGDAKECPVWTFSTERLKLGKKKLI